MKKFLVLLLISALAIFVFAGCESVVPSEGEGEGEGEIEEVTVEIDGSVEVGGKTYVSAGNHDIIVTFPVPVEGSVSANITDCTGYYGSKGHVVLFPNEDKTVWTGSGSFSASGVNDYEDCCASYIEIDAGECEDVICVEFPVIVDAAPPYARIEIDADGCVCEGCEISFTSTDLEAICADDEECCGDDCSGLAGWSIAVFDGEPFDICCETPCEEPIFTCSGTECPIDCTTDCLDAGTYYAVVNLIDNVDNEVEYYAKLVVSSTTVGTDVTCSVDVTEYCANVDATSDGWGCDCTDWSADAMLDTDEFIGSCSSDDNCCLIPLT